MSNLKVGNFCKVSGDGDDVFIIRELKEDSALVESLIPVSHTCWEMNRKIIVISVGDVEKRFVALQSRINHVRKILDEYYKSN
jgi:hypothetical protein